MATVHRKSLVQELQKTLQLSPTQAYFLVRDFFDIISEELANGNDIHISGFGNFVLRDKKARPGRNVITKELVMVTPRRVVLFKAGTKLRKKIKENTSYLLNKLTDGNT